MEVGVQVSLASRSVRIHTEVVSYRVNRKVYTLGLSPPLGSFEGQWVDRIS